MSTNQSLSLSLSQQTKAQKHYTIFYPTHSQHMRKAKFKGQDSLTEASCSMLALHTPTSLIFMYF